MSDPSYALQKAVYETLTGDEAVSALVGTRVFDRVPERASLPFVHIGNDQILDASDTGGPHSECFVTVHAYSQGVGKPQVKQIAGAVRAALDADISIEGFAVAEVNFESTNYITDPDGLTEHAIIEFRYLLFPED